MIIKLLAEKDTYVTNLNTKYIDSIKSNVGHAATLDLYKLYNENKDSYSKAFIDFNDNVINNNSEIQFVDARGNILVLRFDNTLNYENSSYNNDQTVYVIGIANKLSQDYTQIISDSIGSISALGNIRILSYYDENTLVLQQKDKGEKGDTSFDISAINTVASSKINNENKFARVDWSAVLIKVNADSLKDSWASNGLNGAFSDFKAELVLKDVSTGITKPKGFSLSCYKLKKDFVEGVGKDTVAFSDTEIANFKNINIDETWRIPGFISKNNDIEVSPIDEFNVIKGNEDVRFDITSYVSSLISDDQFEDFGFLICLSDSQLYDTKSYFVKRTGSRHLINKSLTPELNVIIDDSKYILEKSKIKNITYTITDRYFDFYYVQNINNINDSFVYPSGYDQITHKVVTADGDVVIAPQLYTSVSDFSGNEISGIVSRRVDTLNTAFLSPANFESAKDTGKLTFKSIWSYTDSNGVLSDIQIEEKEVTVVYYDNSSNNNLENLYVTIKFDKELTGNNLDYKMTIYLIDLKEKVSASRKQYSLKSKNIGDIFYEIVDKDTGKNLVELDDDSSKNGTKLAYNSESYVGNVFISEKFKNKNISVIIYYKDSLGKTKLLKNNNINFKVA